MMFIESFEGSNNSLIITNSLSITKDIKIILVKTLVPKTPYIFFGGKEQPQIPTPQKKDLVLLNALLL